MKMSFETFSRKFNPLQIRESKDNDYSSFLLSLSNKTHAELIHENCKENKIWTVKETTDNKLICIPQVMLFAKNIKGFIMSQKSYDKNHIENLKVIL